MNISLHIERLILGGLPITCRPNSLLQEAVKTELSRLLTERGLASSLQSGGAMPSVRGGGIQLAAASNPSQIGQQIAQAVYSGIGETR